MSKASRRYNVENARKFLDAHDIDYRVYNDGFHYVLCTERAEEIDYWPSREIWIHKRTKERGQGFERLVKRYFSDVPDNVVPIKKSSGGKY